MFSRSPSTVPAGSLAKAASVGANTVNGPGPCSVSASPAAFTAATSVLKLPASTATCTMFFIGFFSCLAYCADTSVGSTSIAATAAMVLRRLVFMIVPL